jgi:hypothetical protein
VTPEERQYNGLKLLAGCGLLVFGVLLDSLFLGMVGFLLLLSLD